MDVLLRDTARSIYLSIRAMPGPVREPLGLGYLLARWSDTVADVLEAPVEWKRGILENPESLDERSVKQLWEMTRRHGTRGEARLVACTLPLLAALRRSTAREEIRKVWEAIREGQLFDLAAFREPGRTLGPEELERYTYLVAGAAGEFWTELLCRFLPDWTGEEAGRMRAWSVAYGKGLQLVNILRDEARDRAAGRCYFEPARRPGLVREATLGLRDGLLYAGAARSGRVRAACMLPALLGFESLRGRLSRPVVYRWMALLLPALASARGAAAVRALAWR